MEWVPEVEGEWVEDVAPATKCSWDQRHFCFLDEGLSVWIDIVFFYGISDGDLEYL